MLRSYRNAALAPLAGAFILLAGACGKESTPPAAGTPSATGTKEKSEEHEKGHIIIVEASSDEKGNYFAPSEVVAEQGDVIRFTLKVGVHNIHFLPDSNPGKSGLPAPSDMLQMPGQTYDLPVTMAKGVYYFQCDPHALLGMKGHLTVKG